MTRLRKENDLFIQTHIKKKKKAELFQSLNKNGNDRAFITGDLTVLPVLKVALHLSLEDFFEFSILCNFNILGGGFFSQ